MVSVYTSVFYTDMFSCRGLRCGCSVLSGGLYFLKNFTGLMNFFACVVVPISEIVF